MHIDRQHVKVFSEVCSTCTLSRQAGLRSFVRPQMSKSGRSSSSPTGFRIWANGSWSPGGNAKKRMGSLSAAERGKHALTCTSVSSSFKPFPHCRMQQKPELDACIFLVDFYRMIASLDADCVTATHPFGI